MCRELDGFSLTLETFTSGLVMPVRVNFVETMERELDKFKKTIAQA